MKELVRIEESVIGTEKRKTVNARDLWKALGSKRQFGNWIEDRLSEFIEEQDFTVNNFVNGRDANGRFTAKDYLLTLDVAKHLAMLERNEQGRKIRQYFIEIEKAYREESRKEHADSALLLETIRRQERELFAAETYNDFLSFALSFFYDIIQIHKNLIYNSNFNNKRALKLFC